MLIKSRREFLRTGLRSISALGAASALGHFGRMNAFAANNPNYKALVCVFLFGGNDGHNTVIPISTTKNQYSDYFGARQSIALPQAQLLPVAAGSDTYGLHPKLTGIQSLYQQGKAAILANVGMLVQPIADRQALLGGAPVPINLYSHSDQQSQWQTSVASGISSTGWGGRLADLVKPMNGGSQYPAVVTTGSGGIFCNGVVTDPTTVPPTGAIGLNFNSSAARSAGAQQLLSFDNGLQLVQAANTTVKHGDDYAALLNAAINSAPQFGGFAATPTASQLKMVARIISVQSQLGLSRQIFFVTAGGFDTHGTQVSQQDALLAEVSAAIAAFYAATASIGMDQQVTTFTTSEFGRTLMPNTGLGTDHAWGSHHFVVGGAVAGAQMYGKFPLLQMGGQDDANGRGAMIPGTSVDQYGATLAKWFGVGAGNLASVFPNINNFNPDLGFLG